jgi:hypothetical protein
MYSRRQPWYDRHIIYAHSNFVYVALIFNINGDYNNALYIEKSTVISVLPPSIQKMNTVHWICSSYLEQVGEETTQFSYTWTFIILIL